MAGGERQLTPAGEVLATPDASGNKSLFHIYIQYSSYFIVYHLFL